MAQIVETFRVASDNWTLLMQVFHATFPPNFLSIGITISQKSACNRHIGRQANS